RHGHGSRRLSRPQRTPLQGRARDRRQGRPVRHRAWQGARWHDPGRVPATVAANRAGRVPDHHRGGLAPRAVRDRRYRAGGCRAPTRRGQKDHRARPSGVRRPGRSVAGLLLRGWGLTGGGKKGPPLPPEVRLPIPPAGLRASIDENAIFVTWTNPGTRIDGSRLRDLTEVRLYRREDTDDDGPLKPAILSRGRIVGYEQIAAIRLESPAPATVRGLNVEWVDRSGLVPGHRYVYVLTALDAQGRSSPPSERRPITFLAAPMPPLDLQATAGNRQVTLAWRPPGEFTDATPAIGEIRYIVLRSVGTEKSMEAITPQPLDATTYTETGLQNDTEYHYAVRAVRVDPRATVTGAPSAVVT